MCSNCITGTNKSNAEDIVVVFGPGPIGLLAARWQKNYGASKVIVVGTTPDKELRLPLAKKLGADMTLVSGEDDVEKILSDLTNGEGIDLAVDCSGAAPAINSCLRMLRKLGRMCVIGFREDVRFRLNGRLQQRNHWKLFSHTVPHRHHGIPVCPCWKEAPLM